MSLQNFLPLRREVREHWVYKDNDYFKLWVEMLFCARFKEEPTTEVYKSQLYTLNQGEFLFSRRSWAARLNISEGKVRTFVTLAIKDQMIKEVGRVGKRGATIFNVTNYLQYNNCTQKQPTEAPSISGLEDPPRPPLTHSQPTPNPPTTRKEERKKEKTKDIVEYLNKRSGKNYRSSTAKTKSVISARIEEGYSIDDFKRVVDIKCSEWLGTEHEKYIRPETLFGNKFEGYLNQSPKSPSTPYVKPKKVGQIEL